MRQSPWGIAAFVLSLVIAAATGGYVLLMLFSKGVIVAAGFSWIVLDALFVAVLSVLALGSGMLGLTDEAKDGPRDGTLAVWALWLTACCWGIGFLFHLVCRLLI
jgi:hypothetical protein